MFKRIQIRDENLVSDSNVFYVSRQENQSIEARSQQQDYVIGFLTTGSPKRHRRWDINMPVRYAKFPLFPGPEMKVPNTRHT